MSGIPFTVEDMHDLNRVTEADVSTSHVVFSSSFWDSKTDVKTTGLNVVPLDGGAPVVLTSLLGKSDFNPKFISENQVVFLSTRSGSVQLHTVQIGSDTVTQVTDLPVDINGFKYSQSGNFFILQIDVFPDCDTLKCTADRDVEMSKNGWKHYDKLMVRNWDHWTTGKVSHLFYLGLGESVPRDLMKGMLLNSPVPPFGGAEQYNISPDGSEVAFTTEDVSTSAAAWTTGWNIYTVSTGSKPVQTCITTQTQARTQNPVYSPDGSTIAYLAMDRAGYEADRLHVNFYDRKTMETKSVTGNVDVSFDAISWDASGKFLIGEADSDGVHKLFSISQKGDVTEILKELQNFGVLIVPGTNSSFIFMRNSMIAPNDIWSFDFRNGRLDNLQQLTAVNEKALEAFDFSEPERIYYPGSLGDKIQGYFLKPFGFDESKSWPLVVLIHGGPQGAFNNDWSYRWNPELWAAQGYAVAIFNFHGSTGFGQNFTDAINGHWGGYPYWDIINGTNYVLKNYKWINKDKISACGASYGGYMINWILGQSDMFNTLVVHDGMFDTINSYYSTEQLWFPEWEFLGKPWTSRDVYEKWNPSNYVTNWATPTLVIHGGRDYRLDITQGIGTFTTLQRLGIPSKFLVFPEENHWVLKPQNGIKWYHTVINWLDQWNKN